MARLAAFVHVTDKNGEVHAFGPDDDVPAWAVKLIGNPGAWEEAPESAKASPRKTTKPAAPKPVVPESDTAPAPEAPAAKPVPGEAFAAESGEHLED